ncbi:hypothetical protein UA75_06425 [Actinoalloteichus sp. GBA129-24]|uniref:Uncharacterized protein n=1 Tax=Actinoalloteichus fjordicus TaxID=1612552 RepID=A0AAC9PQS1_9PSEU|nr:hypothetical protein UA74_06425 [Actinoalloteichus fjordicus]APU19308.1 hypothetical protein UA75_06425 [Actinoalloteichus sp. GBA129-24]
MFRCGRRPERPPAVVACRGRLAGDGRAREFAHLGPASGAVSTRRGTDFAAAQGGGGSAAVTIRPGDYSASATSGP